MPLQIKPILSTKPGKTYNLSPGGDFGWLAQQDYNADRAFISTGSSTRGSVGGGPTYHQMLAATDPHQFTTVASLPPLTTAVLQRQQNAQGGRKVGQLTLDMLDPFGTMGQATGSFAGIEPPYVGAGGRFDPAQFLQSKGIDLFGSEDSGVPARLADYALALPIAFLNKMRGVTSAEPSANPGSMQYRFQEDPGYWRLLQFADTDEKLNAIARQVSSRYVDPGRNSYISKQLVDQMRHDRDQVLTGMTSGNDRIDYMAKQRLATDLARGLDAPVDTSFDLHRRQGQAVDSTKVATYGLASDIVGAIPFVGPQIVAGIAPINPVVENAWKGLSRAQRLNYFGNATLAMVPLDIAASMPALSGLGTVLSIARGSQGIAGTLYKAYDTTLRTASFVMGAGLTVATANWALEAAVPGYSEALGQEIDYARPISKSSLAGVVNELGFWSSGSFGAIPAIQITTRIGSKVAGLAGEGLRGLHVPAPVVGPRELPFFSEVYGGALERADLATIGVNGVETAVKSSFLSHMLNWIERGRRETVEAAIRGEPTTLTEFNAMDANARIEYGNELLSRGLADGPVVAEHFIRMIEFAQRKRPINPSTEVLETWNVAASHGKAIIEDLSADAMASYGPDFIASRRVVGTYGKAEMEAWSRQKASELGGDGAKLGSRDENGWARMVRTLHQVEYHRINGELQAAIEQEASAEAGKIAVIASDHVFKSDQELWVETIPTLSREEASALIADAIATRREAAAWFTSEYRAPAGQAKSPKNVPPDKFVAWLEDIAPALPTRRLLPEPGSETALLPINALHAKIDAGGTWTLAFKPVDADGNFVSYARTRSGGILRSPWVEYPLSAPDNLELGNRGYLASKLDSITRGFRTRQLTEYQRANLFRILTKKVDVLPEQIDALNQGILELARDFRVNQQVVGTIQKSPDLPFSIHTKGQVDELVRKIFGEGDLMGRDGKPVKIDWPSVIGRAYRQSFRLNLTAGLTSYLKSLGPIGGTISYASDLIYPAWRFGLSIVFKGGEIVESPMFNAMRGVWKRDPEAEAAFFRGGLGNDGTFLRQEMAFDSLTQALDGRGKGGQYSPSQRLAASMAMHARRLPEDYQMARETASTQGVADDHLTHVQAYDDTIALLERDGEATDPDTGELLRVRDDQAMADVVGDLHARAAAAAKSPLDLPPLAETEGGLLRQLRQTLATEPAAYTEEGGLHAELNDIVGENGVYPGLEARAKEILDRLDEIERSVGDNGPVFEWADLSEQQRKDWLTRLRDNGDVLPGETDPAQIQAAFARFQRRPGAADTLADIAGTPEALFDYVLPTFAEEQARRGAKASIRHAADTLWHPANFKQAKALTLQIDLVERQFPGLLRASGNHSVVQVFESLGIPEKQWARWLLEDRRLIDEWINVKGEPEAAAKALADLLGHAGKDGDRAAFDELYNSEDWSVITGLWSLHLQATRDEAFGVHFFSPYRSALERGINHPVLGIYPASWALKAAREWGRFLFDNRMFGDLRLGMAPAQAIADITRAQSAAFAMQNDQSLDEFLKSGPLGSTAFIFNLLLPGDWSSLPFPLSRTLREVLRGNVDPGAILRSNIDYLGATRDLRLINESVGELGALIFGKQKAPVKTQLKGISAKGIDDQWSESRR